MNITPINKLYDETDLNNSSFFDLHTAFEVKQQQLSVHYKPSDSHSQYWEYSTLIKSTNPAAGDTVLILEGYRNPRSVLPFYLKDLGCDVHVSYKYHAGAKLAGVYNYGMFVNKEPYSMVYEDAGINLIERDDWMNVSNFGIKFDAMYCVRELEHANPSGALYLSETSYDEVITTSKTVIDSWLTVSDCVALTNNLFGSNCDFTELAEVNGWFDYEADYYHPFTSEKLSELLALYSIDTNYETDWTEYYNNNTPLVHRFHQNNLSLNLLYTNASFIIS